MCEIHEPKYKTKMLYTSYCLTVNCQRSYNPMQSLSRREIKPPVIPYVCENKNFCHFLGRHCDKMTTPVTNLAN